MGREGPNFEHSLVIPGGTILPLGQKIEYSDPVIMKGEEELRKYCQLYKKPKEKKKKKGKQERIKFDASSSDEDMDVDEEEEEDEEEDEEIDGSDEEMIDTSSKKRNGKRNKKKEVAKDIKKEYIKELKERDYNIKPNVVSYYRPQSGYHRASELEFPLDDTQYVVFNPDLVRVRYIAQIKRLD